MNSNHKKNKFLKKLKSYIPSIIILLIFFGCGGDDGSIISGCRGHEPSSAPPRPELPVVTTTLDTSQITVMQTNTASVIVDLEGPVGITAEDFSTSLNLSATAFDITKGTCSDTAATNSCQEWFITPGVNTIPGIYELRIYPEEASTQFDSNSATLLITVQNNLLVNSAPAAISVSGNNGVWHVMTSDQSRWSWANEVSDANSSGASGVGVYYDSRINKINPIVVDIAAKDESALLWADFNGNSQQGLAIDTNGDVYSWGENTSALGFSSSRPIATPRAIPDVTNATAVATTANSGFTIINGEVLGWGSNFEGVRGVGSSLNPWGTEFEIVNNITDAVQLAAGDNHMLALSSNGQVWSWGSNGMGQQGNGSVSGFSVTASTINSLTNIVQIAAGGDFSLALRNDGTVWAWGSNRLGTLGVNSAEVVIATPVQVLSLNNVREIAAMTLNRIPYVYAIDFAPIDNFAQPRPYRWGGGIASPELIESQPAYNIGNGLFTDYNCGIVTLVDGTESRSGFLWDISDRSIVIPKLISFFGRNDPSCPNKLFLHAVPNGTLTATPAPDEFSEYSAPTQVQLTATPSAGWEVNPENPWDGNEDCEDGNVLVQGGVQCIANFIRANAQQLTIQLSGTGTGNVTSQPTGIDCGGNCTAFYTENSTVTLTATAGTNSEFTGWTGDTACTDNVSNTVSEVVIAQATTCIATFDPVATGDFILTVIINGGPGAGEVNSTETPIPLMQCLNSAEVSETCAVSYPLDASVTLEASLFFPNNTLNVTGCDSFVGATLDCFITMDQDKTVTFDISESPEFDITATITGNGRIISFASGAEVGVTGRIECPSVNCNDTFIIPAGAPSRVTFEAHPSAGSTFVSWGTDQCDTESMSNEVGICQVNLDPGTASVRQVDATFQ